MSHPKPIAAVLAQLLARRGYARELAADQFAAAWRAAAGEQFASVTRPGLVKRGVLEVTVAHSALVQELGYRKAELVARLVELLPEQKLRDLRYRVGPIE